MTYRQVRQGSLPESDAWLDSLDANVPSVRTEKENCQVHKICERARTLLESIDDIHMPIEQTLNSIKEIRDHERTTTTWRQGPNWNYKVIHRSEISQDRCRASSFPQYVQIHRDSWVAYEWNYHRTGRIILHRHLLQCLDRLQSSCPVSQGFSSDVRSIKKASLYDIRVLVDDVLSTVPQSLGDIDHGGNLLDDSPGSPVRRSIGGYLLLWPIKILKSLDYATTEQRSAAQVVFERIRECTGMKTSLGELSSI